ncbi:MAG: hypothetical protein JKY01_04805 [Pseudomonadales bacterium]|nr:hypothetical protein [Pseudomonadales bacterium]
MTHRVLRLLRCLQAAKFKVTLFIAATFAFVGVTLIRSGEPLGVLSDQWCLITDSAQKKPDDIERQYGITIHYEDGVNAIPALWRAPPSNGMAEPITKRNMCHVTPILFRELRKYPGSVIQDTLTDIYLLNSLSFYGVDYGGTSLGLALYLTVGSRGDGYNDAYLSKLVHHEMSSVFFRIHLFPSDAWAAVNSKSFAYADADDDILSAIKNGGSDADVERYYHEGFLSNYGYSTLENDFNLYAEMAFTNPEKLRALANIHPRIRQKSVLLKGFYRGISKDFFLQLKIAH